MKEKKLKTSCYGKLPFYKEYIRFGENRRERAFLENLIDKGVAEKNLDTRQGGATPLPKLMFLYVPDKGRRILAGNLWPSSDGLRSFPVVQFSYLRRRKVSKRFHLLPIYLEGLWASMNGFLGQRFENIQEFYKRTQEFSISLPSDYTMAEEEFNKRMESNRVSSLWPWSGGAETDRQEGILRFFRNLRAAGEIEMRSMNADVSVALWVPVGGRGPDHFGLVAFWLQAVRITFGKPRCVPSVFMAENSRSESAEGVFIIFRQVVPFDFLAMVNQQPPTETISDLSSDWGDLSTQTILPPSLEEALRKPNTPLAGILDLMDT